MDGCRSDLACPDPSSPLGEVTRAAPDGWHDDCKTVHRLITRRTVMPHILIVEDEPTTSWALAEGLSDDGFTIDTFASAEAAWEWLRAGGASDLVISDLRLPGMSGLELARKLRRGRHAQPVIIVTAYGTPETMRSLAAAGVSECFPKPFPMDALRRSVREAIDRAGRRRAPRLRRAA
jgi:DNA-binding NtrC family response regulator